MGRGRPHTRARRSRVEEREVCYGAGLQNEVCMRTLCIDIGGTGIKAIVLDVEGNTITERSRLETPQPATPEAMLPLIEELARLQGEFDRISVGFPGVVVDGTTRTAPNLDPSWTGFALARTVEERLQKPARAANDAGVQGLGVIEGRGVEVVLTLGTGMGFGLYVDGRYVPNIELAHHPFAKGKTYEERVSNAARKKIGKKRWNRRVRQVIATLEPIFNYRRLYIGGGNAKHLVKEGLPETVTVVDNVAGLLGGIRLWA
jgi:polyphosphate glucokinase